MMHSRDIFVVHTKSITAHHLLHDGLTRKLRNVELSVWQYGDWEWKESHIERDWRFDDDAVELMSEVDQEVLNYRPPRRVTGNVDRNTLRQIITRTPSVLVFEVPGGKLTSGVQEEVQIIDRELDRLFPLGHFALIRFGIGGYFTDRYPMHCGLILDLGNSTGISEQTIDRIALFALQVLLRKNMVSEFWLNEPRNDAVEILSQWVEKSRQLITSCDFLTQLDPDERIVQLVEELLSWIAYLIRGLGAQNVWERAPSLASWITNRFEHACQLTDLHEDGLLNLVYVLRHIKSAGAEIILSEILRNPVYQENRNTEVVSWKVLIEASRALALAQNRTAVDPLLDAIAVHNEPKYMVSTFLEGLGRIAEGSDIVVRRRAGQYMRDLLEQRSLPESDIGRGLSAFGRVAGPIDIPWLRAFLSEDKSEIIRLHALLALMRITGGEAYHSALDFVGEASPRARRTVGSVAWRINRDPLYDVLLKADPDDEKMVAIIIHSLTRVGNTRAFPEMMACLSSASSYLRGVAIASFPHLLNRCELPRRQIQELVNKTAQLVDDSSDLIRFGAVTTLVRCSQQQYADRASKLLQISLGVGAIGRARILLLYGGLGLGDWPDNRELRLLLFHPNPTIRGAAAFVAGIQRRTSFNKDLELLQNDPSDMPTMLSDSAMNDIGTTVAQCARLALQRITDTAPNPNVRSW